MSLRSQLYATPPELQSPRLHKDIAISLHLHVHYTFLFLLREEATTPSRPSLFDDILRQQLIPCGPRLKFENQLQHLA